MVPAGREKAKRVFPSEQLDSQIIAFLLKATCRLVAWVFNGATGTSFLMLRLLRLLASKDGFESFRQCNDDQGDHVLHQADDPFDRLGEFALGIADLAGVAHELAAGAVGHCCGGCLLCLWKAVGVEGLGSKVDFWVQLWVGRSRLVLSQTKEFVGVLIVYIATISIRHRTTAAWLRDVIGVIINSPPRRTGLHKADVMAYPSTCESDLTMSETCQFIS